MRGFTAEELAEMAAADAEIEAGFRITAEEVRLSRRRDRDAIDQRTPNAERERSEYQRAYYKANKERIDEYHREHYQANKERIAEHKRAYYKANKERIAEQRRRKREKKKNERLGREAQSVRRFRFVERHKNPATVPIVLSFCLDCKSFFAGKEVHLC